MSTPSPYHLHDPAMQTHGRWHIRTIRAIDLR